MIDIFRCLSDVEIEERIRSLVDQITSGALQITSPDAGSVGYMSKREAIQTVRQLERVRARRLGLPADPGDRLKRTQIVIRNDYWQR